jgi:hypothetical protein
MLPDLRFAAGAVLAGLLLIVTAFGLAATVRVAHHTAAGQGDNLRRLANADPFDFGYLSAEPRHVATIKPEVAAANDRAVVAGLPVTSPDANAAPAVGPDMTAAALALPDANAAAVAVPDVDITASIGARDRKSPADARIETPGEQVAALDQPSVALDLTPSPAETSAAPFDVEKPNRQTEPLEASERVATLPAFPTAGPGFVPPDPIALPVPLPEAKPRAKPDAKPGSKSEAKSDAKPAIKRKKKTARKRQPAPAAASPPVATTGYPVPSFDKWWSID